MSEPVMTWCWSPDGATVVHRWPERPATLPTRDETGVFPPVTDDNAEALGYFPFVDQPQPSPDHKERIERNGDRFVRLWELDITIGQRRTERQEALTKARTLGPNPDLRDLAQIVEVLADEVLT